MNKEAFANAFNKELGRGFARRIDYAMQIATERIEREKRPFGLRIDIKTYMLVDPDAGVPRLLKLYIGLADAGGGLISEVKPVWARICDTPEVIADRITIEHARLCSYAAMAG